MANAPIDQNSRQGLVALSNANDGAFVQLWADPTTHRLLVDSSGGGGASFKDNEVVSGSGTSFTLAFTPVAGSQHIYGNGIRLTPTVDYTISGTAITIIAGTYVAGAVLADYRV